jgi:hypothetical protein
MRLWRDVGEAINEAMEHQRCSDWWRIQVETAHDPALLTSHLIREGHL